jgi:hypothetical protein
MTNYSAHKRKAAHNESFLALVQRNDAGPNFIFPDWLITVAFYVALHHVDAKLANLVPPLHPSNHGDRNRAVSSELSKQVANDYLFLRSKSEFARYFPDSEKRISPCIVNQCVNIALTKFL